ncbi:integrase, partial [Acinetobacter sp. 11520]|nr:integrase [Acinetobacter sp. 11520]
NRTKFLRRRREMMQLWADYLDTLRQGGDVSKFKPNNDSENLIHFKPNTKMA